MTTAARTVVMTTVRACVCAAAAAVVSGVQAATTPAGRAPDQRPDAVLLEAGVPIERGISGARHDLYEVESSAGQLIRIVVESRDVEPIVRLVGADGAVAIEAEDSAYENRVELAIPAEDASVHRIEVASRYPGAPAGTYRIRLEGPRETNETDRRLFEARRQHTASVRLAREGAFDEARTRAERALRIREAALGLDHPDVAVSLTVLALVLNAKADYGGAEALCRRALAIVEKAFGADHPALADVLDSLAANERMKGSHAGAEDAAGRALAIREARLGERHALTAVSLRTLADIHADRGQFAKGRAAIDRALDIARERYGPEHLEYAAFLARAARYQFYGGDYARAEALFTETLRLRERLAGEDSLAAADSLSGLAYVALQSSREVESEDLHRRVLAIRERMLGPDHPEVALILNNLGLIATRRRDYRAAEAFHLRALAIREGVLGLTHPHVGHSLNNLGLVYWRQEDYPKAKAFYQRALEVAEAVNGPESLALTSPLANLGILSKETGDYDRAEAHYRRALSILEKAYGLEHPQLRVVVESLGILYRDRRDYARAEPMFLRTLEITERSFGPDHPDVVRHLHNLAKLQVAKGDRAGALASLRRAAAIEERQLPLNLAIGSERQKLAYFRPFARALREAVAFHAQHAPADPAARDLAAGLVVQRKGRVLDAMADSLGAIASRSGPEDRATLDRLRDVTSKLSALVLGGPQQRAPAAHQHSIKALADEREQLEDEVSRRSAGRYARTSPATLAAVQAAVPEGAALVEFVIYRPYDPAVPFESPDFYGAPRYAAYVIASEGEVRWSDLGPASTIDAAIETLREAVQDPRRADVKDAARALDAAIMQPVRALTGEVARLLVSPDGQLALVPFEALVDEGGQYLVERFSFSYLSAGRDLLRMQVPRPAGTAPLLVADPLFGEPAAAAAGARPGATARAAAAPRRSITAGADLSSVYFAPIAGTRYEAQSIRSIFADARVLTGAQATESALHAARAPAILHIATHGFFLDDPDDPASGARRGAAVGARAIQAAPARIENPLLRSGLALAGANLAAAGTEDGILTALEAAHLNLWGTKLVTLSACDTGVGVVRNGEGVYGLRRSIFLAGAETLVMSLWPVSDAVTRELMTAYYKGLKAGLGRGAALRQVQLSMLERRGREHPFYWASFIQAGEWANLEGRR